MIQPYTSPVVVNQSQELWLVGEGIATSGSLAIPSLNLDFVSGVMPGTVTFTRASSATFTGSNGLIQTAAINAPRFDYDPVTLAPRGLLIEEQRTNLAGYSEQFDNAAWLKTNVTVTPNATTAPDGTVTADLIYPSSTGVNRWINQSVGGSAVVYTSSIRLKFSGIRWVFILKSDGSGGAAWFDVQNGVVGTVAAGYTATISPAGNGFYTCSVTAPSSAPNFLPYMGLSSADNSLSVTANGTDGVFFWGYQIEAGTFATSYIPTVASSVTRSADAASVNTLSPWYNATEGTLYVDFIVGRDSDGSRFFANLDDGTNGNEVTIRSSNIATLSGVLSSGASQQANLSQSAPAIGARAKAAIAYRLNDSAFSCNGQAALTDTACIMPVGVNRLTIGSYNAGSSHWVNTTIRAVTYYPRRLSDAELQAITA